MPIRLVHNGFGIAFCIGQQRFDYTYDTATGKLLSATVSDGATSKTVTYNYSDHTNGEKANLIESVVFPTATVTYDYDDFYRASYDVEVSGSDILTTGYTFLSGTQANSTTLMVGSMTNAGNGWDNTLSYTYDCKGNIDTISENGEQKAKYYYDDLNQLVREDNAWTNKTVVYTYDNGGNILNVEEYTLTSASDISSLVASSTDTYAYTDSNWKDKLTSFNGNEITYDEIGNPLNYYNGLNFDWQNGRQLASVSGNGLDISYTYNANGIRTSKTVNGVTTIYTLEGSNVVKETNGIDTIWYYYDAAGSLIGFELNGAPYYYVSNVQGDIIAITDENGGMVVEYLYDSWGKLISITGSHADTIGIKNPHRYRGYYYDTETGLYYLNSRYYDLNTKCFINADGYVATGTGVLGNNMFAYCGNSPITRSDSSGSNWFTDWWKEFKNQVKKRSSVFAVAGGVAGADSPAPGYADIGGAAIALVGFLVCAGVAAYNVSKIRSVSISIPDAKEDEKADTLPPVTGTVIYRYGGTNPGNLTPKEKDKYSGLSFSTVPRPGAAWTTIEALNATGVVCAVKDGATHVSVKPIGGTMEDWINAGSNSVWTAAVKSVVKKWEIN